MNKTKALVASIVAASCMNMSMADDHKETYEEKAVGFRQGVFHALSWKLGQLASAQKSDDRATFQKHANDLSHLTTLITEGFVPNSLVGHSEAKQDVWDNPEGFEKAAQKMQTMANEIASADYDMSSFDIRRFGREGCGGCHKDFKERD